ncbi:hypothetical protein LCGC14_1635860 [marine sediment metagenome]|uniref:Uncharacterized protein n=1 Tax=marine sediment metagenome TaxID=412755 RepID=A0A0F9I1J1_9ZZZZ
MQQFPIQGYNLVQLEELVTPGKQALDMQAVPQPLYDTQTYVNATTQELTFFTTAAAGGDWLTNMEVAGQLPNPDFFVIQYMTMDIIGLPPGDEDNLLDYYRLLFGTGVLGAPYVSARLKSKDYGPWPLSYLNGTGGPTGFTTRTAVEYANNGVPGQAGVWIGGAIVIPPLVSWSMRMRWSAPVTLAKGANVQLRLNLEGTRYRSIS